LDFDYRLVFQASMKSGKELNEMIAKEVMSWVQHPDYKHLWRDPKIFTSPSLVLPEFSTDIKAAYSVVHRILEIKPHAHVSIEGPDNGKWKVRFTRTDVESQTADTIPHAICLAALKTMNINID
jgi:hypothetical protein